MALGENTKLTFKIGGFVALVTFLCSSIWMVATDRERVNSRMAISEVKYIARIEKNEARLNGESEVNKAQTVLLEQLSKQIIRLDKRMSKLDGQMD